MSPLIVILGPTASGKTHLAVQLAHVIDGEIISADSRQVYRGMDIGTGKDLDEFEMQGKKIPHHLIDIIDAGESYHIYQFQQDFQQAYNDILQRGKTPILCGGSGMYLEAVLKGYEFTAIPIDLPAREKLLEKSTEELLSIFEEHKSIYSEKSDTSTKKRLIRAIEINLFLKNNPDFKITPQNVPQAIIFGINPSVELRRERITKRLTDRLANGMIEEVQTLLAKGIPAEKLIFYGLEYKFITQYLNNEIDYQTMFEKLNVAIHQFAKRQMTYFRKMENNGLIINWLSPELPFNKIIETILREIADFQ
ncbi:MULTISPECIES: tRNA (adenosine(37)-N6)-dimethylallyltransferase MiaA [unclassified Arcicella]|uniref:tRNA (adenosine(37)-N6)-dimethylallyltransferase MiaA n=1 Tax=unclassified Arcicella TaxID=2644986 RepID=UPI0028587066|nr:MULTISPECIES: tRNA (adenosine(37)-N6)-dimethylallyltransferase MiaA [unclassified Arcicella]MDR6564620.1 tRNA dimethylallyltransferase [Arcicella sp. BE51]MDR6814452.1 tRNA dimethylallyltransferase [Arcicella sp. BE140]MDR6825792.1 tRNA dimethylallyltransferase [Arcicella sp. BE139]